MSFVMLCEVHLATAKILPYFDHCFMEHLFNTIDNKGKPWEPLSKQLQKALCGHFEDLLHFN